VIIKEKDLYNIPGGAVATPAKEYTNNSAWVAQQSPKGLKVFFAVPLIIPQKAFLDNKSLAKGGGKKWIFTKSLRYFLIE